LCAKKLTIPLTRYFGSSIISQFFIWDPFLQYTILDMNVSKRFTVTPPARFAFSIFGTAAAV
jgi:hypothetical protein